jgi:Zn finger protein HypA/HybF involved in hydrogenase expression
MCIECKNNQQKEIFISNLNKLHNNTISLNGSYTTSEEKVNLICNICNHTWSATQYSVTNKKKPSGCPKCAIKNHTNLLRKNVEDVKNVIFTNNLIPLFKDDEYKRANQKLICMTNDEYKYKVVVKYNSLQQGSNYCVFHGNNPYTIENIKKFILKNAVGYTLLSTTFINAKEQLIWKCPKNHTFNLSWDCFRSGVRCNDKECLHINSAKENSRFWEGGICPIQNYLRNHIAPWKRDTLKKYNHKCIITGKKTDTIHHLYGFNKIFQETFDLLNIPIYDRANKYTEEQLKLLEDKCLELHYKYGLGVCLDMKIHNQFHLLYGFNNNTEEQFEDFKQKYILEGCNYANP